MGRCYNNVLMPQNITYTTLCGTATEKEKDTDRQRETERNREKEAKKK